MGDVAALTWPLRRPGGLLAPLPRGPRRCLFGAPDQEGRTLFLKERMSQLMQDNALKWNFDFANDKPMPGQFKWKPVGDDKSAGLEQSDPADEANCAKTDDSLKITECSSDEKEQNGTNDKQTLITDFMRKRKSCSSPKSDATRKSKVARRSSWT